MADADPRIYRRDDVVSFRKTTEPFGGLSNMAGGFPIRISGVRIATAEALYQACRFPHMPEVQRLIIAQASPMTAKMKSKPYRSDSRADWDAVRVPIMKWCLRVKLAQNWSKFGALLLETGERPIVEDSRKDDFWGAMPDEAGVLRGRNVLGRLLMELRERLKTEPDKLNIVLPVPIPDFLLFSAEIPVVAREASPKETSAAQPAPSFLEMLTPDEKAVEASSPPDTRVEVELALAEVTDFQPQALDPSHSRKHRWAVWFAGGGILLAGLIWLLAT